MSVAEKKSAARTDKKRKLQEPAARARLGKTAAREATTLCSVGLLWLFVWLECFIVIHVPHLRRFHCSITSHLPLLKHHLSEHIIRSYASLDSQLECDPMLTHRRRIQRLDVSPAVDQPPPYEERDYWRTSSATLIDPTARSSMANPVEEQAYERRFRTGHYVGFYLFAILIPPGVFFLCHLPDRPPWRDFKHNLAYLVLGFWIGGAIHACLFVSDVYRYQNDQQRRFFHQRKVSTLPKPEHAYDNPRRATGPLTVEHLQTAPQINIADSDSSPKEAVLSRPGAAAIQDEYMLQPIARQESILPDLPDIKSRHSREPRSVGSGTTARTGSAFSRASTTVSSVFSRTASKPGYQAHKGKCPLCARCDKCFHEHIQYREETRALRGVFGSDDSETSIGTGVERSAEDRQYSDHSRERHLIERHHVGGCCCETCTGLHRPPRAYGDHTRGCVCDFCKPSNRQKFRDAPRGPAGSGVFGRSCGAGGNVGGFGVGGGAF
ncbi:hypothetical protein K491DRAFT_682531 [Lophiostoma macrostomum CBS 122681]|uniref:Uncharacterized protein n=1 Tax=Lophiostoma macrostomum CBS 122681 TaxID=1314788 RepID=A0A6A6ST84_9PLEO|nr:hypothetical protein K491DRAFT_682531 [Lophiostoma macrostomum CBS 122681]